MYAPLNKNWSAPKCSAHKRGVSSIHTSKQKPQTFANFSSFALLLTASVFCLDAQAGPEWASLNRYVEVGAGVQLQNYREQDTFGLTPDQTLNSERGAQSQVNLVFRWQSNAGWFAEVAAERASGPTDYTGYLQSGNSSLQPYNARTGNVSSRASIQIGYALDFKNWSAVPINWQFIPVVQLSRYQWDRKLEQYSEAYRFDAQAIGAITQWKFSAGTLLEAKVLAGTTGPAKVSVVNLGFDATQASGSLSQWQLAISQDLATTTGQSQLKGWRMAVSYSRTCYSHGASPTVSGLQAPPNESSPSVWVMGVQRQF